MRKSGLTRDSWPDVRLPIEKIGINGFGPQRPVVATLKTFPRTREVQDKDTTCIGRQLQRTSYGDEELRVRQERPWPFHAANVDHGAQEQ